VNRAPDLGSSRPLLDKLGIKPGAVVSLVNFEDKGFAELLATRTREVSTGRPRRESDHIFLGAGRLAELQQLRALQAYMKRNGAIWVVRPRGRPEITEAGTQAAGLEAGLVDVKVVRFSDTHTAEKFVIRLRDR
jgi:hypothetical protein